MRNAPWTDQEQAAVVALYFTMLDKAISGLPYNKAAMIRASQNSHAGPIDSGLNTAPLKIRSRGSIEAKLMNVSAAHRDYAPGNTTMDGFGYRCLSNYQSSLKDHVISHMVELELDAEIATSQANEQRAGA